MKYDAAKGLGKRLAAFWRQSQQAIRLWSGQGNLRFSRIPHRAVRGASTLMVGARRDYVAVVTPMRQHDRSKRLSQIPPEPIMRAS